MKPRADVAIGMAIGQGLNRVLRNNRIKKDLEIHPLTEESLSQDVKIRIPDSFKARPFFVWIILIFLFSMMIGAFYAGPYSPAERKEMSGGLLIITFVFYLGFAWIPWLTFISFWFGPTYFIGPSGMRKKSLFNEFEISWDEIECVSLDFNSNIIKIKTDKGKANISLDMQNAIRFLPLMTRKLPYNKWKKAESAVQWATILTQNPSLFQR